MTLKNISLRFLAWVWVLALLAIANAYSQSATASDGHPARTLVIASHPYPERSVVNKALQQSNLSLEFSVDPSTKTPVIKMMDSQSGKVIRQYPSEEVIAIAQSIDEYLSQHQLQSGMLLKQKA